MPWPAPARSPRTGSWYFGALRSWVRPRWPANPPPPCSGFPNSPGRCWLSNQIVLEQIADLPHLLHIHAHLDFPPQQFLVGAPTRMALWRAYPSVPRLDTLCPVTSSAFWLADMPVMAISSPKKLMDTRRSLLWWVGCLCAWTVSAGGCSWLGHRVWVIASGSLRLGHCVWVIVSGTSYPLFSASGAQIHHRPGWPGVRDVTPPGPYRGVEDVGLASSCRLKFT